MKDKSLHFRIVNW